MPGSIRSTHSARVDIGGGILTIGQIQEEGIIAGGSGLTELYEAEPELGNKDMQDEFDPLPPVHTVDFDFPATHYRHLVRGGDVGEGGMGEGEGGAEEFFVLDFRVGDREDPFNWPARRKRFISGIMLMMTLFIGLGTTAYSSGTSRMIKDLHVSSELGQMGLFCFNQTCAVAPLFLAPFCEMTGRKVVYTLSFLIYSLCFIGLALGKNIATILVMRTLLGFFGSVGTILVGGTFSDMYMPDHRALPMAAFSYVAILGTVAAPIYAGFIDQAIGWRWIEGIQGLSNVPLLFFVVLGLRETRGSSVLHKRAELLRKKTNDQRYKAPQEVETESVLAMLNASLVRSIWLLISEPVVLVFGLWIGFAWGVTFLFLSVIPITFSEKRNWGEGVSGLPYISLCIGCTIGFITNGWQIKKFKKVRASTGGALVPEARLYGAMFGGIMLPIGLFVYSFTQYGYLIWVGPVIALAPITIGIFFIFESCYSYTSDCYGDSSSSAIAGQGFLRNTLGGVTPLFASQFFHNVGSQYAGLILALVATLLSTIPFVLFLFGKKIRSRSKIATAQLSIVASRESRATSMASRVESRRSRATSSASRGAADSTEEPHRYVSDQAGQQQTNGEKMEERQATGAPPATAEEKETNGNSS